MVGRYASCLAGAGRLLGLVPKVVLLLLLLLLRVLPTVSGLTVIVTVLGLVVRSRCLLLLALLLLLSVLMVKLVTLQVGLGGRLLTTRLRGRLALVRVVVLSVCGSLWRIAAVTRLGNVTTVRTRASRLPLLAGKEVGELRQVRTVALIIVQLVLLVRLRMTASGVVLAIRRQAVVFLLTVASTGTARAGRARIASIWAARCGLVGALRMLAGMLVTAVHGVHRLIAVGLTIPRLLVGMRELVGQIIIRVVRVRSRKTVRLLTLR